MNMYQVAQDPQPIQDSDAGSASLSLLLVDHNGADRTLNEFLLQLLPSTSTETVSAQGLGEALPILMQGHFDAVLVDLGSPDRDTTPVVSALRDARNDIPIVVLTGHDSQDAGIAAVQAGAQDYLVKDRVKSEALLRVLRYSRERQAANTLLADSQRLMQTSLDALSASIAVLGEDGCILFTNRAWHRFAENNGAKPGTVSVGVNYLEACRKAEGPDRPVAKAFASAISDVINAKQNKFEIEYACNSPEEHRWFLGRVTPIGDAAPRRVIVSHENITAGHVARQRSRLLAMAVDQSAESIVITDAAGTIEYVNPAFADITGYSQEEAIGKNPRILNSGTHAPEFYTDMWGTLLRGEAWQGRITNRRKDGTLYTEDASISPLRDADGSISNYVAVKHDISEQLQLAQQLQQSQKLESIGTLAGGVAHEINNPINGIMNYAQLIADSPCDGEDLATYAGFIIKESERVAVIVRNLLSFARQDKTSHSPACISDIVNATLSLTGAVMRHDQITLETDVPEDLPSVKCRSQQIQQVIMNLLTNARDALNDKYPGHDENKCIWVRARPFQEEGQTWVKVTVEDTGTGVHESLQEAIFEPFFTTKSHESGTGLGLSISHGIIRDHGGRISVNSTPGEGTRFTFDLKTDNGW